MYKIQTIFHAYDDKPRRAYIKILDGCIPEGFRLLKSDFVSFSDRYIGPVSSINIDEKNPDFDDDPHNIQTCDRWYENLSRCTEWRAKWRYPCPCCKNSDHGVFLCDKCFEELSK